MRRNWELKSFQHSSEVMLMGPWCGGGEHRGEECGERKYVMEYETQGALMVLTWNYKDINRLHKLFCVWSRKLTFLYLKATCTSRKNSHDDDEDKKTAAPLYISENLFKKRIWLMNDVDWWLLPASLLLTRLCEYQSHCIAADKVRTSIILSLAMFSKCSAHGLQPKKLRT